MNLLAAGTVKLMPNRVLLQPAPLEYGLYRVQYKALIEDLETEGVLVRLLEPVQERGLPTVAQACDLVIQVGEVAGATVGIAKLVEIVRRRLRGQRSQRVEPRRARLYLDSGGLHEFSLDEEEE